MDNLINGIDKIIKLDFHLISRWASGWLAWDKLIKIGNSDDMGIREELQGRNSHILENFSSLEKENISRL